MGDFYVPTHPLLHTILASVFVLFYNVKSYKIYLKCHREGAVSLSKSLPAVIGSALPQETGVGWPSPL